MTLQVMSGMEVGLITQFHVRRIYGTTLDMTFDEIKTRIENSKVSEDKKVGALFCAFVAKTDAEKMWAIAKPSVNLENVQSNKQFWEGFLE